MILNDQILGFFVFECLEGRPKIGPKCQSTLPLFPMTWHHLHLHLRLHLSCGGCSKVALDGKRRCRIQITERRTQIWIWSQRYADTRWQAAALAPSHYFNYLFTQDKQTCRRHLSCLVSGSSLKVTSWNSEF